MASEEIEFIVNVSSTLILYFSFGILTFLSYRLLKGKDRSYIENTFGLAVIIAAIASLQAAIFRTFYVIFTSGPLIDTWRIASYLYFVLMSLSLTLIFTVVLGILGGRKYYWSGFVSVIGIIPITVTIWFIEGAVTTERGFANINLDLVGLIFIFGILGLQIVINSILYYYVYIKTKNKGSLYIVFGMAVIALSAAEGGISDYLGDIGRLFDPIAYIGILIGLLFIFTAVELLNHDFSKFLPYFAKLNSR